MYFFILVGSGLNFVVKNMVIHCAITDKIIEMNCNIQ